MVKATAVAVACGSSSWTENTDRLRSVTGNSTGGGADHASPPSAPGGKANGSDRDGAGAVAPVGVDRWPQAASPQLVRPATPKRSSARRDTRSLTADPSGSSSYEAGHVFAVGMQLVAFPGWQCLRSSRCRGPESYR